MQHIALMAIHLKNSGPLAGKPGEIALGIALLALLMLAISSAFPTGTRQN